MYIRLLFLILLFSGSAFADQESCYLRMGEGKNYLISDYAVSKQTCRVTMDQRDVEQLRTFTSAATYFSWVVDKRTLQTYIVRSSCLTSCEANDISLSKNKSRYSELLKYSTAPPFLVENDGLTKDAYTKNNYLTIDLCPSSKTYEKSFFQYLASTSPPQGFPIAISISGGWMTQHQDELKEI